MASSQTCSRLNKRQQGQHPQRLLGIVDTILVPFGYYFTKIYVVGGTIGAVRLHSPSIANFRVKGFCVTFDQSEQKCRFKFVAADLED